MKLFFKLISCLALMLGIISVAPMSVNAEDLDLADYITADQSELWVAPGESVQLAYTLHSNTDSSKTEFKDENVTWSFADASYEKFADLSEDGTVTGIEIGTLTVNAKITNGNEAYFFIHVCPKLTQLLFRDDVSYQIARNAYFIDIRNYLDVEPYEAFNRSFTITSDNTEVMSPAFGTMLYVNNTGKTNITVTSSDDASFTATHEFEVCEPFDPTEMVAVTDQKQNIYLHHIHTNALQVSYVSGAAKKDTEWTSSDPEIVSVTGSGAAASVTGNKTGTATVTATSKNNPELSVDFEITVIDELPPEGTYETTVGMPGEYKPEEMPELLELKYGDTVKLMIAVRVTSIYPANQAYIDTKLVDSDLLKGQKVEMLGGAMNNDGSMTFTMNVTFKAEKPGAETTKIGNFTFKTRVLFTDVENSEDYFFAPVYWAAENKITVGAGGAGKFSPSATCTREQIVTFLWRLMGEPEPDQYQTFTDVKPTDWFYKPISWAASKGITVGLNDGTGRFGVGQPCTREQCVTFLHRAAGKPAVGTHQDFTDVASDRYYYDAISWAASNGITVGLNDGTGRFGVGRKCTRAMIVTFLHRYNNLEKE